MNTDLIVNAVTGLGSGLLGFAGATLAARTQARPAQQAAEAARAQADAAYRSALDSAHAQIFASALQETNAARRPVYSVFARAAERLVNAVFDEVINPDIGGSEYDEALRAAQAAYADLPMEGPPHIVSLGAACIDAAIAARRTGDNSGTTVLVLKKITALRSTRQTASLGVSISTACDLLGALVRTMPDVWFTDNLLHLTSFPERDARLQNVGGDDADAPSNWAVDHLFAKGRDLDEHLREAARGFHLDYDREAWHVYWALFRWKHTDPWEFARETVHDARASVRAFGTACGAVLHGERFDRT
ncbi:hypothetical protein [Streptomyces sp. NPDC059378]|uniref:hypothetical protein n=1 Tax=Streptomyces sp. NPDC059378 TaxID=3346815 RepID=UPI003673BCEC